MASFQHSKARLDTAERERVKTYNERKDTLTQMPGRIVDFDPATQTATVEVMHKMTVPVPDSTTGETKDIDYPNLVEVPVMQTRGGGFAFTKPIKEGDGVLLNFASRPLDTWYLDGEKGPHESARMHDLSDAIAIPGLETSGKALSNYKNDRFEIRNEAGDAALSMTDEGKFQMFGSSGEELFTILYELLDALENDKLDIKTGSSLGKVHALENKATYADLKARLDTIKG